MVPADGERRFNSAMRATVGRRRAARNEGGATRSLSRSRSRASRRPRRAGRVLRVALKISSSRTGILSFGGYSGTFFRALFGNHAQHLGGVRMPLTKRQSEILGYLQTHINGQGYAPSFEEIAEQFGFQSLATVHEHLTNLERKGYIRRSYNESRSIEVLPPRGTSAASEIPLLGRVAAGTPIESLMHQESIAVPEQMLPRRGPNYALRVQGTSMIDEHIVDGDIVVVHGKQSAENGEMVIALVNGNEATVKKFYREPGGWIRLQPANATMQPMRFQEREVLIQGVVVGVIRKY